MSDLESIKRVLMATKEKAKGMRKAKMSARVNPAPEPMSPTSTVEEEASEPDAVKMAEGAEDDESKEDPESLKEAIRELLARV